MRDHDQRFKELIKEFLAEFFLLFFAAWYERFDFSQVEWLEQELHLDPPQGQKEAIDLLARIGIRPGVEPRPNEPRQQTVLIHIEVEWPDGIEAFRRRMYEYYRDLSRKYPDLDILPIALYLRVGLDGRGIDVYERYFWERRPLRFEYDYVGLPALPAEEYLRGRNLLGVSWSALMRMPRERRAQAAVEALERIVASTEHPWRKLMLAECVQGYAPLDESQRIELTSLLQEPQREGVRQMFKTSSQEGEERGEKKGRQEMLLRLLQRRFSIPLSPEIKQRITALSTEALDDLAENLFTTKSLKELGLED